MADVDRRVSPYPTDQKLGIFRRQREWKKKYGSTHNRDGSPKTKAQTDKVASERAAIRARFKRSKESGGIGPDAWRRYSGEGEVDNQAVRTLQGSAERAKRMTETSKKSITDSQKKRPQSKAKSSIPDAQKKNRMDASSTMTDAQKRRAVRKAKSAMPDSQRRSQNYGTKSAVSDDQKKGQVRKVESKTTSSPTQSSEGGQTFKQAFAAAHKKYKAGKGPRDFKWTNPKDGKTRSYAAVTQAEVEKAHKAGKIDAPTLASFLGNKKPKDEKKKKKSKRGSLFSRLDKFLQGN